MQIGSGRQVGARLGVLLLLVAVVGCGKTGNGTGPTTTRRPSTPTAKADDGQDRELAALLLPATSFGDRLVPAHGSDADASLDTVVCDGEELDEVPRRQAYEAFTVATNTSYVAESIGDFASERVASLYLWDVQAKNAACLVSSPDDAYPGTFVRVDGMGDEALRGLPDKTFGVPSDFVFVRKGRRLVVLVAVGDVVAASPDGKHLPDDVITSALQRAEP